MHCPGLPSWHDGGSCLRVHAQLLSHGEFSSFQTDLWNSYMEINSGGLSILQRPDWEPPHGRSSLAYLPPVMDCLTAAADDIAETLLYIDRHRQALGLSMAIVHGDQQTYKRMLTLMIDDSSVAKWLLPKPGEWHFTAHFAEAMFHPKLGLWSHFIGWFTRQEDSGLKFCTETVLEGGFQIKKFDQYCMFLEAIICACTIYLSRYVPMHLLECPQTLRHIARSSGAYGEFMVASMLTLC